MSLVRKELIRPDRAEFAGDDGFRFVHVLVQDAAYASMAKELRAELHERFAGWLEEAASGQMGEYEEIVGYHLEQAYRYRAQLGPIDHHGRELGRRAAVRLAAAAERASYRGDTPAQVNLLSRSVGLLPSGDAARPELLAELGPSLMVLGDFARAEVVLAEAIDAAATSENPAAGARARIARADLDYVTGSVAVQKLRREAEGAIQVLEAAGDDLGLARAWHFRGTIEHGLGLEVAAQEGLERSLDHARLARSKWDEIMALEQLVWVGVWGPTHRSEALRRCDQFLEEVKGHPELESSVLGALGCLRAFEGRFDEARALAARRMEILKELGLVLLEAWGIYASGWVEMLAGDPAAAEDLLRPNYETLEELGATASLLVVGSHLAQAVCMQGRFEEAERLALAVEQLDPTSVVEVALARCARAKAIAALGRAEEGERLAREAIALIDQTDFLGDRADARMDLAEVLRVAGRFDEAAQVLEEDLCLYEQKGNLVSAERTRELLAELGSS
jgi:tetratricopeptide (TPR) repeat protein